MIHRHIAHIALVALLGLLAASCHHQEAPTTAETEIVGPRGDGSYTASTRQIIRPAGDVLEFHGRPVDIALSPDGRTAYAKDGRQLLAIDVKSWTLRQSLTFPPKATGTMHGIAARGDGGAVYVGAAQGLLLEAAVEASGQLAWKRQIEVPGPSKRASYPCGIALSADGTRAYVCLSMNNTLAVVDLTAGKVLREIPVGIAPFGVALTADGSTAYVSNWGGRRPRAGEATADSGGTETLVDERGIASSGTVSIVDVTAARVTDEIPVGLHPSDLELDRAGRTLYVANANSDTLSVIDTTSRAVRETITVRPDPSLPFGSAVNALCLSGDEKWLFAACGGNNAVAVVRLAQARTPSAVEGFIPAGWYPAGVCTDGQSVLIANAKGYGSRAGDDPKRRGVKEYLGTLSKVSTPDAATLATYTSQVRAEALVPQSLRGMERGTSGAKPVPVPKRVGEPSVFEHVVYVIKENRTYDQVFGDIGKGNSDPALCVFGRKISPNHHALAEQFVLLDNFYCNGVVSADGHAWATEGLANDYLEKSFGSWSRSYPYAGDDPMAFASSGFLWDNALLHGLSFRNYGEMSKTTLDPAGSRYSEVYKDHVTDKTRKIAFKNKVNVEPLAKYSHPGYPGWNLRVPDAVRADIFIDEFHKFESSGQMPNLTIVWLPCDHTSGTAATNPTPASYFADNDLALGRIVEAISGSKFWSKTCIFVVEDDPQSGFDHVDGHRSLALVVSPYTKRGSVISKFYNQTSVLRTMELMLGLPPMNQMDAMAPSMDACFTSKPNLAPYHALPNGIPLNQLNPPATALAGRARALAEASARLPLDEADRADEDTLNRILWHSLRGVDAPYPAAFAGAHGRGLRKLNLKLDGDVRDDD